MIDFSKIQESFTGRIGWRQPTLSGYDIVDSDNLSSSTGLYFNSDFHRLTTIRNIKECQEDNLINDGDFNTYLSDLVRSSLVKVLNSVFDNNDLIENFVLYPYAINYATSDLLPNGGDFVGYEIRVANDKDITTIINSVIAEFDSVDTFDLYIFNSNKQDPISDPIPINTLAKTGKYKSIQQVLEYSSDIYKGGRFYVGYYTDVLTAKAVNRSYELSSVKKIPNTFSIRPIKVSNWTDRTLFDLQSVIYTSHSNGLNFDLSSVNNYTDRIISNIRLFDTAIGYQVAADVLELIISSTRDNSIEREVKAIANLELNGTNSEGMPHTIGLKTQIKRETDKIKKNLLLESEKLIHGTLH